MKTKIIKKSNVLIIVLLVQLFTIRGQLPPSSDANWILNSSLSDEFSGTAIDLTKWQLFDGSRENGYGLTYGYWTPSFVTVHDGYLDLKADIINGDAYTAGIGSNYNYLYGYYEMRAILPGYFNTSTNQPCSQGFWSSFWTYYIAYSNGCWIGNEIDINEPSGLDGTSWGEGKDNDARSVESHYWFKPGNCLDSGKSAMGALHNCPPLYENYHKFAVEFLPGKMIFYFDDIPYNCSYNGPFYPTHFMRVVMDHQLQRYPEDFNSNTPWPNHYIVDYFRFFNINTSLCNVDATISNNSELANFQNGIRRNIYISSGSGSINLINGSKYIFRQTNDFNLQGSFTAPLGSELIIIPTPCN